MTVVLDSKQDIEHNPVQYAVSVNPPGTIVAATIHPVGIGGGTRVSRQKGTGLGVRSGQRGKGQWLGGVDNNVGSEHSHVWVEWGHER